MLRHFGEYVCRHWHEPDNGIWEPRTERQHYTHSRLLCWVALDRLLELHAGASSAASRRTSYAEAPRRDPPGHRRAALEPDAGELHPDARREHARRHRSAPGLSTGSRRRRRERMAATYQRIQERLGAGPGLLYRYEQSFEGGEGAFAMCCFWLAEFLARGGGSLDEARDAFAHTLAYANDLGLFAEEIDPKTGDALGNFPQAFTHVGLINAALSLAEREARSRTGHRSHRTHESYGTYGRPRSQAVPEVHR